MLFLQINFQWNPSWVDETFVEEAARVWSIDVFVQWVIEDTSLEVFSASKHGLKQLGGSVYVDFGAPSYQTQQCFL